MYHNTICTTVWKLREFSLNHFWQKFRENSSFTKEGGEREFLIFSHCGTENPSYLTLFFDENFVKITGILKKLLKIWFHDFFFFCEREFLVFPHYVVCMYVICYSNPDVMMKSYNESRWSAAFFISYLSINLYFLMNLMLAVVYDAFTKIEKEKFRRLFLHKRKAAQHAFKLLVTQERPEQVSFQHLEGLLTAYRPRTSKKPTAQWVREGFHL